MGQTSTVQQAVGSVGAYTAASDVDLVRHLRAEAGTVTVAGKSGLAALDALQRAGDLGSVDLDPADYLNRDGQLTLLPRPWIERQRELGLSRIRSAGVFINSKDDIRAGLVEPLPNDVYRVLSLHGSWLRPARATELARALAATDGPLSLIFAAPFDPFDGAGAIDALRDTLAMLRAQGRPVELLRCDITALGFVADGGSRGTIGVTSNARHHPQGLGNKAGKQYEQRQSIPQIFIPQLLSWQRATWLRALAPFGGAGITECPCTACDGQSLLRFAEQWPGQVPAALRNDARAHDVATWRHVADAVLGSLNPAGMWQQQVAGAMQRQAELAAENRVLVNLPRSLTAWAPKNF